MMYSAHKLNKQGDKCTALTYSFSYLEPVCCSMSSSNCCFLTVASWPACRFLRRQVRWSGIPISWRVFHSLLWSSQSLWRSQWSRSNVFLEFSCFFYDQTDVGNLISGSSAFSKSSLNKIGKGVFQGSILSPCLFNFYAEYIMQNAGLDEAQAGIKIARRNINNLRYADDTTLMEDSEELNSLLMKWKKRVEKLA